MNREKVRSIHLRRSLELNKKEHMNLRNSISKDKKSRNHFDILHSQNSKNNEAFEKIIKKLKTEEKFTVIKSQ
jgi:hypothetical protein